DGAVVCEKVANRLTRSQAVLWSPAGQRPVREVRGNIEPNPSLFWWSPHSSARLSHSPIVILYYATASPQRPLLSELTPTAKQSSQFSLEYSQISSPTSARQDHFGSAPIARSLLGLRRPSPCRHPYPPLPTHLPRCGCGPQHSSKTITDLPPPSANLLFPDSTLHSLQRARPLPAPIRSSPSLLSCPSLRLPSLIFHVELRKHWTRTDRPVRFLVSSSAVLALRRSHYRTLSALGRKCVHSVMASSTRGKWSAVGTIVSAPIRGFYYPGRVKAIKRSVDQTASSPPLYSVIFSDPLGSLTDQEPSDDQGLILDFTGEQLIGRGLRAHHQCATVYITHRGREVSARVLKHEQDDMLQLILDADSQEMSTKLSEVRLLPSRKSGRVQEHPDYSLLASGRRSPTESENEMSSGTISGSANSTSTLTGKMTKQAGSGRRRTTSSSSTSLLSSESSIILSSAKDHPVHTVSAHIDVPSQSRTIQFCNSPE
ncbi:hypothetical protein TYRP_000229, partial [Tyrophagus putrescentiae]